MAAKKLLLEKLYGRGEIRPFDGVTMNQADLRKQEVSNAIAHMRKAGVDMAGRSESEVFSHYYSQSGDKWDNDALKHQESKSAGPREFRYYTMHPNNAQGMIDDLRADPSIDFTVNSHTRHANKFGVAHSGSHNYTADAAAVEGHDSDVVAHPRIRFSVNATQKKHDDLLNKHAQHLVFEGRTFDSFFKEALDSVTVAGVDGIPRTMPVKNEDDGLENNDGAIYNGVLPNPADTLNKIFDADTQARLAAVYGPNWHQLVSQSLAHIPTLQPNNRETITESTMADMIRKRTNMGTMLHFYAEHRMDGTLHEDAKAAVLKDRGPHRGDPSLVDDFHKMTDAMASLKESVSHLTEELAAALNYVNSVDHGNQKPRFKSAMAWLEGVGHLYGEDVAGKANDVLYSKGHKAALDFVREAAKSAGNPKTVNMSGAAPSVGRLNDGPYSQLHSIHLAEDFRPGLLNPSGIFGRQPDEVYTKHHGNFSTDYNRIGPYDNRSKGVPEDLLYTNPHVKTLSAHLDGLKAAGKIQGYKWEHYVDEDSRSRARLKVTATHSMQKSLAGGEHSLNSALHSASQKKYDERDAFLTGQRIADGHPGTKNNIPLTVSDQDRKVHRILKSNPDTTDEELAAAWDSHVASGDVHSADVPNLVRRYRIRVAYHQGKGNLPE